MLKDRSIQTFLIGAVFVLLFGLFKPQAEYLRHENPISRAHFWVNRVNSESNYDILLLGDSRIAAGVSPQEMGKLLPDSRIINLGMPAGGFNQEYYSIAEERFDRENPQKIIVLGITPHAFTPGTQDNKYFHRHRNRPFGERWALQNLYEPLQLKQIGFLLPFFYPFKQSEFIHAHDPFAIRLAFDHVTPLITGQEENLAADHKLLFVNFYDDGWQVVFPDRGNLNAQLAFYKDAFSRSPVSERLLQGLISQTEDWVQQGVHVFAFRLPVSEKLLLLENQLSGFDEQLFVQRFEAVGGFWLSYSIEEYDSADGSHLGLDSALRLSNNLAQDIRHHLDDEPH